MPSNPTPEPGRERPILWEHRFEQSEDKRTPTVPLERNAHGWPLYPISMRFLWEPWTPNESGYRAVVRPEGVDRFGWVREISSHERAASRPGEDFIKRLYIREAWRAWADHMADLELKRLGLEEIPDAQP